MMFYGMNPLAYFHLLHQQQAQPNELTYFQDIQRELMRRRLYEQNRTQQPPTTRPQQYEEGGQPVDGRMFISNQQSPAKKQQVSLRSRMRGKPKLPQDTDRVRYIRYGY